MPGHYHNMGSILGQNYGLLGSAMPQMGAGMGVGMGAGINPAAAGSPLGDAVAALRARSVAATPLAAPVGSSRMPPPMPALPMIQLGGDQPSAPSTGMGAMGMGGKQTPLFWGENAAFPETGANISNAWKNLFSNIGGFFGGGGSQFPNWTGSGNTALTPLAGGRTGTGFFNF